jgi:hypothetical protein
MNTVASGCSDQRRCAWHTFSCLVLADRSRLAICEVCAGEVARVQRTGLVPTSAADARENCSLELLISFACPLLSRPRCLACLVFRRGRARALTPRPDCRAVQPSS